MPDDSAAISADDTPDEATRGYQHRWRLSSRRDDELKSADLFVIDAYAEHYYHGKEAMRGVGVSVERLMWYTGLGRTAVTEAVTRVKRRGWLKVVKGHTTGKVARYALVIPPEFSTALPQEPAPEVEKGQNPGFRDVEPGQNPGFRGHTPSPSPSSNYLRGVPSPERPGSKTKTTRTKGGRAEPKTNKQPPAPVASWEQIAEVVPLSLRTDARVRRSKGNIGRALAACLAAGWSVRSIRDELADVDGGKRPAGLIVWKLNKLAAEPVPEVETGERSLSARTEALMDAGQMCAHEYPDTRNSRGEHVCPHCRQLEAGANR